MLYGISILLHTCHVISFVCPPPLAFIHQYQNYYTVYGMHKTRGNVPHCPDFDTRIGFLNPPIISSALVVLPHLPLYVSFISLPSV